MQSHRTLHKHNIPATRQFTGNGKVGRPVGSVAPQGETVIILEDIDFCWTPAQISDLREMWRAGISGPDIAVHLRRDEDEVSLLVMDQRRQNKIRDREGGWFGCSV